MKYICALLLIIIPFMMSAAGETGIYPGQEKFFNVSDFEEEIVTYPEIWQIDGHSIYTQGTWVIARFMLSVRVLFKGTPTAVHIPFAQKIALYALDKGYRKNASMLNNYHDSYMISDKIAVTLLSCDDNYNPDGRMYNYTFTVSELTGSSFSEANLDLPDSSSTFAEKLQDDISIALQKKNTSNLKFIWDIKSLEKFDIFKNSLKTVFDYISAVKNISVVSVLYAGSVNDIKRYKLYFKIENSSKDTKKIDLYAVAEISFEKKPLIYSIQFVIY